MNNPYNINPIQKKYGARSDISIFHGQVETDWIQITNGHKEGNLQPSLFYVSNLYYKNYRDIISINAIKFSKDANQITLSFNLGSLNTQLKDKNSNYLAIKLYTMNGVAHLQLITYYPNEDDWYVLYTNRNSATGQLSPIINYRGTLYYKLTYTV